MTVARSRLVAAAPDTPHEWCVGVQPTEEIVAVVLPGNDPSVAVTRRLGMEPTGRTDRWFGLEMDSFRLRRPA